jgi:serine/threonine-protein kinase RsbW
MAAPLEGPDLSATAEKRMALVCATEVVPVVETILAEMAAAGYRDRDIFDVRLALEEAIVNAVKHGNRCDPGKKVFVRFRVDAEQVVAEIEDQGPGFDPQRVPDPTEEENLERSSGRGLLLIRAYTTWMRYNDRGNCLTLCKRRSAGRAG